MRRTLAMTIVVAVLLCAGHWAFAADPVKIRFGVLPVLQALPLYVAKDKGLFEKADLDVDLVLFNATAEKEIALTAGSIDGYFGDLVTPTVLIGNNRDIFIVATNYDTLKDRRSFAIVGKPGSQYKSVADLAGVSVAVSSNSVIDLLTERLLVGAGIPKDKASTIESKNIGVRMQMLLSGQLEAATLPEPLVTAAQAKGAVVLGDDKGLAETQTVLVFAGPYLKANAQAVKTFLKVCDDAAKIINEQPESVRPVMVQHVRLPEAMRDTYPVPKFPAVHAPDKDIIKAVCDWLKTRGIIQRDLTYEQVVNTSQLP